MSASKASGSENNFYRSLGVCPYPRNWTLFIAVGCVTTAISWVLGFTKLGTASIRLKLRALMMILVSRTTKIKEGKLEWIFRLILNYKEGFWLDEAQKTLLFENRLLNIQVKKEMVFDEDMFILDFLFLGVKHGNLETIAESHQKRSKQGRYTKGEAD
ncbi:hypothetical protein B0J14DRAFT_569579 [Halenospora varia]|nr:hypothetical protein B0J14DRAFT_569579 [Halenospora varia]